MPDESLRAPIAVPMGLDDLAAPTTAPHHYGRWGLAWTRGDVKTS